MSAKLHPVQLYSGATCYQGAIPLSAVPGAGLFIGSQFDL